MRYQLTLARRCHALIQLRDEEPPRQRNISIKATRNLRNRRCELLTPHALFFRVSRPCSSSLSLSLTTPLPLRFILSSSSLSLFVLFLAPPHLFLFFFFFCCFCFFFFFFFRCCLFFFSKLKAYCLSPSLSFSVCCFFSPACSVQLSSRAAHIQVLTQTYSPKACTELRQALVSVKRCSGS